jgi:O-antigen/teichoic acid export membrane protein
MQLRHAAINLVGLGAPLAVAVVAIPPLVAALGADRFGLLTLIWAVTSYFGVFDLGLGRALTQQLAALDASTGEQRGRARALVATALALLAVLGVFAALLLAACADWGIGLVKQVPDRAEAVRSLLAMAVALPAVVLTAGLRGVLEARHAFGTVNAIRLPMGLFTFLGPLVVVAWAAPRLDLVAAVLSAGRVVAAIAHAVVVRRLLAADGGAWRCERRWLAPLATTGGWLSVSNLVSPFLGYLDRFLIAGAVSAAAVAWYAVPHELVTKLWIVPSALTSVMFPSFATQFARTPAAASALLARALGWVAATMVPLCVALALLAEPLLRWWIDAAFARESARVLQILALGMIASALASVPYTAIQGAGRARTTALIHLAELPVFVAVVTGFTLAWGVVGAASAWTLRAILDAALMFYFARRLQA